MVVQELLSLRQQQAPRCQRNVLGTYCHSLDETFYSQSHWIWSKVEGPPNTVVKDWENHFALYRMKVYKGIMYMKFWITVSTNGVSTRLCHKCLSFYFFWFRFGCAWLRLAEKFLQKRKWLFFFVVATRLSCNAKQHNCQFLVLKKNIQNVAAGFALFTVVETSCFIGWIVKTLFLSKCWLYNSTRRISNSRSYYVVHTQFFLSNFGWLKWDFK